MMKKRFVSGTLVLLLLFALFPATTAWASYGNRAKQAWQYIFNYIQQHGTPNGGNFAGVESKTVRRTLQENKGLVDFSLGNWNHYWTVQLNFQYQNPSDSHQTKRQSISLQFVENYWQEEDGQIYENSHVNGTYSYKEQPNVAQFQTSFSLVPSRFPNANAARLFDHSGVSEIELEAYRVHAFELEQDLLTLLDYILSEGGYSVADLGFTAYQGHTTHRYWGESNTLAPTCTADGYESGTCYVCGTVVYHSYPALGHTWKLIETLTAGESLHESTGRFTCTRCGDTVEERLCAEKVFTDMPREGNWAHKPIDWAYFNGITGGKTATAFAPKDFCTRAEVVTFLWAAKNRPNPEGADCPFTDVKQKAYYYKAMLWAVENGITGGTAADKFSPKSICTRAEVVTFLWAAAGKPMPKREENPFTDVGRKAWYYKAVLWAVENGITSGTSPDKFSPKRKCTRAEVVTFLYKTSQIPPAEAPTASSEP